LIYETFQAPPQRCLFAKLRANGEIRPHIDQGAYFERTVRIHFPVVTNPQAIMLADKQSFHMQVGEAWALNNSAVHGVVNKHPTEARTHLICDYLPTEHLRQLLRDARNRPSA
jgi:aspartyl/asparaginyl beta-hydroxylase (cupin superfamily)